MIPQWIASSWRKSEPSLLAENHRHGFYWKMFKFSRELHNKESKSIRESSVTGRYCVSDNCKNRDEGLKIQIDGCYQSMPEMYCYLLVQFIARCLCYLFLTWLERDIRPDISLIWSVQIWLELIWLLSAFKRIFQSFFQDWKLTHQSLLNISSNYVWTKARV